MNLHMISVVPRSRRQTRRRRFQLSRPIPRLGGRAKAGAGARPAARPRGGPAAAAWQPIGVRVVNALTSARVISLLLLLVCAGAFGYAVNDASFYVTRPEVAGRQTIPLKDVYAMSHVVGLQVFWVNPDGIAAALKASPSIADARVEVTWPAEVRITLVERAPAVAWQQAGAVNWVAADGRVMPARGALPGLLTIVAEQSRPLPEDTRAVSADVVQGALALRALRPNITTLNLYEHGGLEYNDGRGWQAFFGQGEDMPQKLAVYESLVDYLLNTRHLSPGQIEYIVVTDVQHPFYKVRGE